MKRPDDVQLPLTVAEAESLRVLLARTIKDLRQESRDETWHADVRSQIAAHAEMFVAIYERLQVARS